MALCPFKSGASGRMENIGMVTATVRPRRAVSQAAPKTFSAVDKHGRKVDALRAIVSGIENAATHWLLVSARKPRLQFCGGAAHWHLRGMVATSELDPSHFIAFRCSSVLLENAMMSIERIADRSDQTPPGMARPAQAGRDRERRRRVVRRRIPICQP